MGRLLPLLSAVAVFPTAACGQRDGAEVLEFRPKRVVKAFPAIKSPPLVPVAKAEFMRDEELVLGVQLGAEARAYPINMLTGPTREIINDELGGRAIAATW